MTCPCCTLGSLKRQTRKVKGGRSQYICRKCKRVYQVSEKYGGLMLVVN